MAEISKVNVNNTNYDIKDSTARNQIAGKQDTLTFDTTPTADSTNPVTSGGIKTALNTETTARENVVRTAFKTVCPNNDLIADETGALSAMVYIPKFKNSDVLTGGDDNIHPAFIVNDQEIDGFWYGKFQAKVNNNRAYSLPAEDPAANITFDTAIDRCTAKGAGWHLSTNAEWAAVALWCKKNGFLPYGNNNNGKDSRDSNYRAIPTTKDSSTGNTFHVASGTGPLTWSHDKTPSGIWDMNGNVSEWQGGIRLVWGELHILANNDAADPDNPQSATSTCWKAINASTGALVTPECSTTDATGTTSGNTVRLDYVGGNWVFVTSISSAVGSSRNCNFGVVTADSMISDAAKVLLRALALLPDSDTQEADYEGDKVYLNNGIAESCVTRGGHYNGGVGAGVFFVSGYNPRSASNGGVGFRCAYRITESGETRSVSTLATLSKSAAVDNDEELLGYDEEVR